jgi:hypothetical protein
MTYDKNRELDLDTGTPVVYRRGDEMGGGVDREKSRDVDPAVMWTGPEAEDEQVELEPTRLSTIRIVALTIIMVLTYFLGVSGTHDHSGLH